MFKKSLTSYFLNLTSFHGFTIIELIIVFSVLAIISSIGVASFVSYTKSQELRSATLQVKTILQQARSQASAQVKPSSCGIFQGYEVRICCVPSGSNCPACNSSGNYELDAICSSVPNGLLINSTTLSSSISVKDSGTTHRSFLFIPITGGVVTGGTITLQGANNATESLTVTSAGIIQ